ncbi:MAG: plastoquinol--plastocyanin reductase [Ignavibacteriae bacterium HGW-Ignavibacteriae-3]|nr:MAG: plastoquinol--plastocyanin reductase [Ignavibacteriae bacterium HGW-Ignavibacteriae-3]
MKLDRRKFLNTLLGVGGIGGIVAVLYPVFSFLIPPKSAEPKVNSVKAGLSSELPTNSAKIIKFGREPVILIKTEDNQLKALSAGCTHLDCIVQYKTDTKQILCACHNGIYDLNGRNVSGPPPRPLEQFDVKVIQDEIVITKQG